MDYKQSKQQGQQERYKQIVNYWISQQEKGEVPTYESVGRHFGLTRAGVFTIFKKLAKQGVITLEPSHYVVEFKRRETCTLVHWKNA